MTFQIKLLWVQNHCVLGSIKKMELLKFIFRNRYLVLFGPKMYDAIYNKIRYPINKKCDITYSINHNFARIRTDSYNPLPIEKTFSFQNVIILIKSVFNKNKYCYYYIYF